MKKIENQQLSINDALTNYVFIVPDYQREYVWGEKNISQFIEDIYEEYQASSSSEYFIGSTVVTKSSDKEYEVIDGQQRLTTMYVWICAFKKVLAVDPDSLELLNALIASRRLDESGNFITSYNLSLQYADSTEIIKFINEGNSDSTILRNSAERIFAAYDFASKFLLSNFSIDGEMNVTEVRKFMSYFLNKVKFIQIETDSVGDALKTFETINDRGVGLDPMDLLKNLLFRQVSKNEFKELNTEWKAIIDRLDKAKEKKLRFLRYFIMANYDFRDQKGGAILREEDIYDWISKNDDQCGYSSRPFDFVRKIDKASQAYVNFASGKDIEGRTDVNIQNIKLLGGWSFSQHLILMLSAIKLEPENFNNLAKNVETLIFYYTITKTPAKDYERKFSQWAKDIQVIASEKGEVETRRFKEFVSSTFTKELNDLNIEFSANFRSLRLDTLQSYKIRYILAKLALYIDHGRIDTRQRLNLPLDEYIKTTEIEHILPNTETDAAVQKIGSLEEYELYKIKLGNLTLLEKPLNVVASNKMYNEKTPIYLKSRYYITKSLVELDDVGSDTSVTRIDKMLRSYSDWNKTSIDDRQEILFELAKNVWFVHEPIA